MISSLMKLSYLKKFLYIALALFSLLVTIISFFSINLPDYSQLKNYKPSINIDPSWKMVELENLCEFSLEILYSKSLFFYNNIFLSR